MSEEVAAVRRHIAESQRMRRSARLHIWFSYVTSTANTVMVALNAAWFDPHRALSVFNVAGVAACGWALWKSIECRDYLKVWIARAIELERIGQEFITKQERQPDYEGRSRTD